MSESESTEEAKGNATAFSVVAWASLIVPFLVLAVVKATLLVSGHTSLLPPPSRQFIGDLHGAALLADVASMILGLFSLLGIRRYGVALILWKALPGIVVSGLFGFFHFAGMMMSSIIC